MFVRGVAVYILVVISNKRKEKVVVKPSKRPSPVALGEYRGDKLNNPREYYETIKKCDFKNYEDEIRNQAISSAIKSERVDLRFERHLIKFHVQQQAVSLARGRKLYVRPDLI